MAAFPPISAIKPIVRFRPVRSKATASGIGGRNPAEQLVMLPNFNFDREFLRSHHDERIVIGRCLNPFCLGYLSGIVQIIDSITRHGRPPLIEHLYAKRNVTLMGASPESYRWRKPLRCAGRSRVSTVRNYPDFPSSCGTASRRARGIVKCSDRKPPAPPPQPRAGGFENHDFLRLPPNGPVPPLRSCPALGLRHAMPITLSQIENLMS